MQDMESDSVQPTGPEMCDGLLSPCSPSSPIAGKVQEVVRSPLARPIVLLATLYVCRAVYMRVENVYTCLYSA